MTGYFDSSDGLAPGLARGANSKLLLRKIFDEMHRRPDMIYAEVTDRGHIPCPDEPESLNTLSKFLKAVT